MYVHRQAGRQALTHAFTHTWMHAHTHTHTHTHIHTHTHTHTLRKGESWVELWLESKQSFSMLHRQKSFFGCVFCQARHCGAFYSEQHASVLKGKEIVPDGGTICWFLYPACHTEKSRLFQIEVQHSHASQFLHPDRTLYSGRSVKIQELTNTFPHRGKQLPHVKKQLQGIKCMTALKLPAESSKVILML